MAADNASNEGDLLGDRVVSAAFTLETNVLHVATDTCQIGADLEVQAAVRITRMIARIVDDRCTDRRREISTLIRSFLDGARSIAVVVVDIVIRERVVGVHPEVFRQRETQPEATARLAALERRLAHLVDVLVEQVETSRHVAIKEARFSERQVDLEALHGAADLQAEELTVAEQVALRDAHVTDHTFTGGVTGTERQLTRRLLQNFHVDDDAVRR